MIEYFLKKFPTSTAGNGLSKFKKELTFLRAILNSNPTDPSNYQRVIDQINLWEAAANNNEIIDTRPLQ